MAFGYWLLDICCHEFNVSSVVMVVCFFHQCSPIQGCIFFQVIKDERGSKKVKVIESSLAKQERMDTKGVIYSENVERHKNGRSGDATRIIKTRGNKWW